MVLPDPERSRLLGRLLSPARLVRIVDVGAHPSEPPPYMALMEAGLAELWAFEPQKSGYDALIGDPIENRHVFAQPLGDGGVATLNICESSGFTSLLEPNPQFNVFLNRWHGRMSVKERVEMQTCRLDDLDEIPSVDLLKIDIQGGELTVFEHGVAKLSSALGVITEVAAVQLYKGQPLLDDQMRAMRKLGLELHRFLFFKAFPLGHDSSHKLRPDTVKSQLVDGDAVFVRALMSLEEQETDDLKRLVLLADGVFESVDLALHVLHILDRRGALPDGAIGNYIEALPDEVRK